MSNQYTQYSVQLENVSDDFLQYLLLTEKLSDTYDEQLTDFATALTEDNPHEFGDWEIWYCSSTNRVDVLLYAEEYEPNMEAVNKVIQKYVQHDSPNCEPVSYVSVTWSDRAIPDGQAATVYTVKVDDVRSLDTYQIANVLETNQL